MHVAANEVVEDERTLVVVGAGAGGVPEMVKYMNSKEVMWALLRFEFGTGSFARTKLIFLQFAGEEISFMRRAQATALTKTARHFLRSAGRDHFHAAIEMRDLADVTAENIMNEVSEYFVVDAISGSSTANMIKEYHEQLAKEQLDLVERKAAQRERHRQMQEDRKLEKTKLAQEILDEFQAGLSKGDAAPSSGVPALKKGLSKASLTSRLRKARGNAKILTHVSMEGLVQVASGGLWNWVLIGPDVFKLPLIGGGSGGVEEMRKKAEANSDIVMFGLLRLVYSSSGVNQTRCVLLHVVGEDTSGEKRGKLNALRPYFENKFSEFAQISAVVPNLAPSEMTQEHIISKLPEQPDVPAPEADIRHPSLGPIQALLQKVAADPTSMIARSLSAVLEETEEEMEEWQSVDEEEEEASSDSDAFGSEDDLPMVINAAPHAEDSLEAVNGYVRSARLCNWALVRARQKNEERERRRASLQIMQATEEKRSQEAESPQASRRASGLGGEKRSSVTKLTEGEAEEKAVVQAERQAEEQPEGQAEEKGEGQAAQA